MSQVYETHDDVNPTADVQPDPVQAELVQPDLVQSEPVIQEPVKSDDLMIAPVDHEVVGSDALVHLQDALQPLDDAARQNVQAALPLMSFQGRMIISQDNGQKLGGVDDVLVDPANFRVYALVTVKNSLLRSEVNALTADQVTVWGQDAVLVKRSDALTKRDGLPNLDSYLSAYQTIPGRDVISQSGDRLAEVKDLLINPQGELVGFVVDRARGELQSLLGSGRGEQRLAAAAMHSFGRDVLILDLAKLQRILNVSTGGSETA